MDLADQHAFVTGGGSGIGLACARAFLADGATVTIAGRSRDRLESAAADLDGDVAISVVDISDEASVADAIAAAHARVPLSIAVANAGTGAGGPFLETSTEDWDRVIQTNLNGTFYTLKHAGRAMQATGGVMCAISSIAGLRTHQLMAAYCTSKAGIDMLVRSTADELGAFGIRVNSVCPGLVVTELSAGLHQTDAIREDYLSCMPIRRVGQVDDIANAVRFLCGPESSWVTGTTLAVDGGHHLRRGPNILAGS